MPLTIMKGEKYETKYGKEKATQKEENKTNLQTKLSNLHNWVGNRVGRIASLLYQNCIIEYVKMKVNFKITKHKFDWKAFIGWLIFIGVIMWFIFK